MRDEILEYYKSLLALAWMYPDEKGFIYTKAGDVDVPAILDGKHLILPTRQQLKNTDWSERLIFNPMHEEFNLGVSDTLTEFRGQVINRLNATMAKVFEHFVNLGINQDVHKHLNTEQGQVLNALVKVTDKTAQRLSEMRKKMSVNNTSKFISVFIKRGGMVNGEGFSRVGVVNFPLYKELLDPEIHPGGVKLTKDDRKIFKELYEFIFPFLLTDADGYSVGVNSRTAPNLECFLRSVLKVVGTLMETTRPYKDLFPDFDPFLVFPEDLPKWIDLFDNKTMVEKAARAIPKLPGSEGKDEEDDREDDRREVKESETSRRDESEVREEPAPKPARKGPMRIGNMTATPNSQAKESPAEKEAITRAFSPRPRDIDHSELARERRARELEEEEEYRRDRGRSRSRSRGRDYDDDDRGRRSRSRRDSRDDYDDDDRDTRRRRSRGRDDYDDERDRGDRGPRSIWDNPVLRDAEDDARYEDNRRGRSRGRYYDDRGRRDPWGRSLTRR